MPQSHTLLVDESGVDSQSNRIIYVGCLIETSELETIHNSIISFNTKSLSDPLFSGKLGLVNRQDEVRHFVNDNESLKSKFIDDVLRKLSCRVYSIMDIKRGSIKESKISTFSQLISVAQRVREIKDLQIIVEKSEADKYLKECGALFKDKSFLPLSIADYYAGILHRFHEKRIHLLDNNLKIRRRELNSLDFIRYEVVNHNISFEIDLSTNEISSRRDGRYFMKQIEGIVYKD